jgi:uncharacterized protein YecE (DUF72 family)
MLLLIKWYYKNILYWADLLSIIKFWRIQLQYSEVLSHDLITDRYSQPFQTAELDVTFYERFYSKMTPGTFHGMIKATPDDFQFSVKVPEIVTHEKRLDVKKDTMDTFNEFLEKISPLKKANKLDAILIQLPPSFSVDAFKQTESFLDRLPSGYEYAIEFRHPSWQTEGPWEILKQYNVRQS